MKLHGLDKYILFSISFTILYTICEFIVSIVTNISHDVLTTCVYGFFAGEIVTCGLIKIFKLRLTDKSDISYNEDTEEER